MRMLLLLLIISNAHAFINKDKIVLEGDDVSQVYDTLGTPDSTYNGTLHYKNVHQWQLDVHLDNNGTVERIDVNRPFH